MGIFLAGVVRLLLHVPQSQFHEFDRVNIGLVETCGEIGDPVGIVRPRHTAIDFAEQIYIRLERIQRLGDGVDMAKPLDVPEHDPRRSLYSRSVRLPAGFDLAKRCQAIEMAAMVVVRRWPCQYLAPFRERHRGKSRYDLIEDVIVPVAHAGSFSRENCTVAVAAGVGMISSTSEPSR